MLKNNSQKRNFDIKRLLVFIFILIGIAGLFHLTTLARKEEKALLKIIEAKTGQTCKTYAFIQESTTTYGQEADEVIEKLTGYVERLEADAQAYQSQRNKLENTPGISLATKELITIYDDAYNEVLADISQYKKRIKRLRDIKEDEELCEIETFRSYKLLYTTEEDKEIKTCLGRYNVIKKEYTKIKIEDNPWEILGNNSNISFGIPENEDTAENDESTNKHTLREIVELKNMSLQN